MIYFILFSFPNHVISIHAGRWVLKVNKKQRACKSVLSVLEELNGLDDNYF